MSSHFSSSGVWSEWYYSEKWMCMERYLEDPSTGQCSYEYMNSEEWRASLETPQAALLPPPIQFNSTPSASDAGSMSEIQYQKQNTYTTSPSAHKGKGKSSRDTEAHRGKGRSSRDTKPRTLRPTDYPDTGITTTPSSTTWISTKNKDLKKESLDPRFKTHNSKDFEFGRIFKVLWSEPSGNGGTEITVIGPSKYNEAAFHKIRRFLIVSNRSGHCLCLTNERDKGGQGTKKYGSHPEHHAVIYSDGSSGEQLPGEEICRQSIACTMSNPSEKLDPASRLNYEKIYTVEHNVKVCFVGKLASQSEEKNVIMHYNDSHPPLVQGMGWAGSDYASSQQGQYFGNPQHN